MADADRAPKRQKLSAATKSATGAALPTTEATELAFYLTRLKNAPPAHNGASKTTCPLPQLHHSCSCALTE
jgi:hypothetical protein